MNVFEALCKKIDEQLQRYGEDMIKGSPKDYPAYRESVGLLRGLGLARQEVEDLAKAYKEDDDE